MDRQTGEQVFYHGHPSWRGILSFYLKGLLLAILAGVIAGIVTRISSNSVSVGWVAPVVGIGLVLTVLIGLVMRIRTTYTISNQRLTIVKGLIARDVHEARLDRVQAVNSRQSLIDRILQVGTVDFDTAATADFDFAFRGVSQPEKIVVIVDHALHQGPPLPGPEAETQVGP